MNIDFVNAKVNRILLPTKLQLLNNNNFFTRTLYIIDNLYIFADNNTFNQYST
jgi:hypothetical protein